VIVFAEDKKRALDYSNLVEICENTSVDNYINDDRYEIVVSMSDNNNKALNTSKNFQLLDISMDHKILQ
jgi:hypothetical protein